MCLKTPANLQKTSKLDAAILGSFLQCTCNVYACDCVTLSPKRAFHFSHCNALSLLKAILFNRLPNMNEEMKAVNRWSWQSQSHHVIFGAEVFGNTILAKFVAK